ncbi:MAG: CDP-alcohol phosphatidyltransferase family protein [Propionibacteriaceae bacterium]|nr:CDP-alcohol phosphatidyltransferase family protein [Propionibacteriaceae bacterium]
MRNLPNALAALRLLAAPTLLLLIHHPAAFTAVYLGCFVTDVLDGMLARRLHATTTMGARLDSLADFVLGASAVVSLAIATDLLTNVPVLVMLGANMVLRVIMLAVAQTRFGFIASVHTWAAKATTGALHIGILACLWLGRMSVPLAMVAGAIGLLAACEQLILVATRPRFEPDCRGLWDRSTASTDRSQNNNPAQDPQAGPRVSQSESYTSPGPGA